MNIKNITAAALAAMTTATLSAAVPEVSSATMVQDVSRLVTITYTLADAPAVVTLDVQTNYTENGATKWASIGGAAVANAQGDVWKKVSTGSHTITWRPDHSWPDHKIADGGARAVVTAWALDNTPDYMVVDITATGGEGTERYYPAVDFLPGSVPGQKGAITNNPVYKTTMIVMRKILAKDVTWTMGSVAESGRAAREVPHQVTLTNNYYIGVYPVTQTQWQKVTGYNPSNFTVENSMRPVEMVSYTDIRQGIGTAEEAATIIGGGYPNEPYKDSFLGKLRYTTKLDFDLPSEAQWEFAARAGNGEGYWGDGSAIQISSNMDASLNLQGRYLNNPSTNSSTSPAATITPANGGTAIVGSYAPNAWGLYDVHGNVWEWCLDWHADDITALNGAVNSGSGVYRAGRGGSWNYAAGYCRSAFRYYVPPARRLNETGFRLVCTAGLQ